MMWTGKSLPSFLLGRVWPILLVCSVWGLGNETPTTNTYLTNADRIRLKQVFSSGWTFKDLPTVHYAVLGYKLLNEVVANEKEVCKYLLDSASAPNVTPESYYYITVTWKSLGSCTGVLPSMQITEKLSGVLDKEGSSVTDIFYAVQSLRSLGKDVVQSVSIIKAVQAILKKDDSISNVGYSLHIASELGTAGAFAMDRIEDAVVQADEVDGKYLQFEGGLTITALVVSGAYRLGAALDKPPGISGEQAQRFANYFLSRRSVQTPKGAHALLNVLQVLANNKFQVPVVVSVEGGGSVGSEKPNLSMRLSDVLGRELPIELSPVLESATRLADSVVVLSKKKFTRSMTDRTVYSVNIMESKPDGGVYKGVITIGRSGNRLVGGVGITLPFRVTATPLPHPLQIGAADADQTTTPKLHTVKYPNKLVSVLELDSQQKLVVRFSLKDKANGKPLGVHQAFLRLVHTLTNQEVIFVTDRDSANNYKLDLDIGGKAGELGWVSGKYKVQLIVGDVILAHSFAWDLADINIKLAAEPLPKSPPLALYTPKLEIRHLFREPEKRPPVFVSNLFTALVLLPLLVLFGLWIKLGVNISNFPLALSAIGFHIGLAGIFCLFGLFWLKLNMFETLKYLIGLGVVTFLCGNNMLAKIASYRKH